MTRWTKLLLPAALLTLATTASAETYVSLGTGPASLGGDLGAAFDDSDASAVRLSVGQRYGAIALEASVFGSGFDGAGASVPLGDYSTTSIGVDLKYHFGLLGPLEAYVKGGLNKTWLSSPGNIPFDHSGTGYALGGGVQWRFKLPVTSAALWLDYTHQSTDLRWSDNDRSFDGSIGMAMVGASIGF